MITLLILLSLLIAFIFISVCALIESIKQSKRASEYFLRCSDLTTEIIRHKNNESALHTSIEELNNRIIELAHTNESLTLKFNNLNNEWLLKVEEIKKDSINRSRSILRGKALEQFVAFSGDCLSQFSPSDFRMMGSPIDVIIFDGVSDIIDGNEKDVTVYLCDVKSGKSKLSKVQRAIKKAIEEKRIEWKTLEMK